jgi:hypothetical protein
MVVAPPAVLPAELRGALLAEVDRCTVTNSLRQPPRLDVDLDVPLAAAGPHT